MARTSVFLAVITCVISATSGFAQAESKTNPFHVSNTFHVGGDGGWDYLTVDGEHHALYVPRSSHTMVLDAKSGEKIADIPGQKRNHGVAIVPSVGRGFISDGEDGSVTVFDLKSNRALGTIKAADDADAIIYDEASDKLLVSCGDAAALVPIAPDVDPKEGKADAPVDLGGKPESLIADGKGKVYVALEDKDQIAVVDTKTMKVIGKWPTAPGGSPVGMAIDPEHGHLFVGCRKPQKLLVMSTEDGKVLADLPIGAGVDATKFDNGYAFCSCRDGTLAIARETAPGKFEIVQTVKTRPGARTMGVDPTTHMLYLPTAELSAEKDTRGRQRPKPNSFMIVVVSPNHE